MHEAARIMAAAGTDEILVSDLTRALAGATELKFEDRGTRELKGLDGEWKLAAYVELLAGGPDATVTVDAGITLEAALLRPQSPTYFTVAGSLRPCTQPPARPGDEHRSARPS